MKEPAAFFWLFVHPHQKSFLSVTTDVIYTVIGPTGIRQDKAL